ncbi:MAG: archaeosortase A [Candidatus Thermoplasmatota archaeon]
MRKSCCVSSNLFALIFFLLPTGMLCLGFVVFPYPASPESNPLLYVPLFGGLLLLGCGYFWKEPSCASVLKILGWTAFMMFWAFLPSFLYYSEDGDIFNAVVCIVGVYFLMYVAYHEWVSIRQKQYPSCLNWLAGGTFIAGMIYFMFDSSIIPFFKKGLIELVAQQSAHLMNLFGLHATINPNYPSVILYQNTSISIIFACTAIQSMVLFIGMLGALSIAPLQRRLLGIVITVIPIYFLNLFRNASVIFLVGNNITDFHLAHNVIAKAGSLIALVVLLFITFKITPQLYDEIMNILRLPKRQGPVENFFKIVWSRRKEKI